MTTTEQVTSSTKTAAAKASKTSIPRQSKEKVAKAPSTVKTTSNPKKAVSREKPATPPKVIAEVHLIPLDRIEIGENVRTEFPEESIAELAQDIDARGLRQPVEVTPIGDERYRLRIGGRRFRAFQELALGAIPALIVKSADQDRVADQLTENIHREDLSLTDMAAAVRQLYEENDNDFQATCRAVSKSKGWLSKHLALTADDLGPQTRRLLSDAIVTDLEVLTVLRQIEDLQPAKIYTLEGLASQGRLTRETARQALIEVKHPEKAPQQVKPDTAAEQIQRELEAKRDADREADRQKREAAQIERTQGTGDSFIAWAMHELETYCLEWQHCANNDGTKFLHTLSEDQRAALDAHIAKLAENARKRTPAEWIRAPNWEILNYKINYINYIEQTAEVLAKVYTQTMQIIPLVSMIEAANGTEP